MSPVPALSGPRTHTGDTIIDVEGLLCRDAERADTHTRYRPGPDTGFVSGWLAATDAIFAESVAWRTALVARQGLHATLLCDPEAPSFGFIVLGDPDEAGPADEDDDDLEEGGQLDAVDAVERLAAQVGVTVKDVLRATGIKRSTFYSSWRKAGPDRRPRLASQGKLWAFVEAAADLDDLVGGGLRVWLLAEPRRLNAFLAGRFGELTRPASKVRRSAEEVPVWTATYGVGGDRPDPDEQSAPPAARPRQRRVPAAPTPRRRRPAGQA